MARLAYLTMESLEDFECYDELTYPALIGLGHTVDAVPWRKSVDWHAYDAVIIRSTWDYQDDPARFLAVLAEIEGSSARLVNPLSVVQWNIHKGYLRDLQARGVAVVPTRWSQQLTAAQVNEAFQDFGSAELIIKPAISANADDTYRVPDHSVTAFLDDYLEVFRDRDCLLQPFMPSIVTEGEFSVFLFDGAVSHAILKTPKTHDFRVQEEHGGRLQLIEAPEPALLAAAYIAKQAIDEDLLYARLDFVRADTTFLLMEAELIEPSLYFNLDPGAAERFARALTRYLSR